MGIRSLGSELTALTEADVERAALYWLAGLGWSVAYGPDISPDGSHPERTDNGTVVLEAGLQVLLEGVCEPGQLPALIRGFVVFEDAGSGVPVKMVAG